MGLVVILAVTFIVVVAVLLWGLKHEATVAADVKKADAVVQEAESLVKKG